MKNQKEIERLMELSNEELLLEIGKAVQPVKIGIRIPSPDEVRLAATNWINEQKALLQKSVCSDSRISDFIGNPSTERRIEIIAVVADIISTHFTGVPAFTLAVLLTKEGLVNFCGEHGK